LGEPLAGETPRYRIEKEPVQVNQLWFTETQQIGVFRQRRGVLGKREGRPPHRGREGFPRGNLVVKYKQGPQNPSIEKRLKRNNKTEGRKRIKTEGLKPLKKGKII